MGLFVRQDEQRSQLQKRVAENLKDKLATSDIKPADKSPAILDDEHQTRPAGVVIVILLVVALVASVVVLIIK